jgi:hypothetical protein
MGQIESNIAGIFSIFVGLILIAYTIWDLKAKKIHRTIPVKEWKISSIIENFGLPRHEIITPKNHSIIFWFIIIIDFILAIFSISLGIILLFFWNTLF